MTADDTIEQLGLSPHPEGGHYRQTYRAGEHIPASALAARYDEPRATSTGIYFLLRAGEVSHLHRLKSDEMWHFYTGSPLIVHVITPDGGHQTRHLGLDLSAGQQPQYVVPHGCWFGAEVAGGSGFALVGNTVAPGFDFADFELADRADLSARFPAHADLIAHLTPD